MYTSPYSAQKKHYQLKRKVRCNEYYFNSKQHGKALLSFIDFGYHFYLSRYIFRKLKQVFCCFIRRWNPTIDGEDILLKE